MEFSWWFIEHQTDVFQGYFESKLVNYVLLAWGIFTKKKKSSEAYGIQLMIYWTSNWRIPRLFWVQARQLCFARHGKAF